jgi:hypothetical protein
LLLHQHRWGERPGPEKKARPSCHSGRIFWLESKTGKKQLCLLPVLLFTEQIRPGLLLFACHSAGKESVGSLTGKTSFLLC